MIIFDVLSFAAPFLFPTRVVVKAATTTYDTYEIAKQKEKTVDEKIDEVLISFGVAAASLAFPAVGITAFAYGVAKDINANQYLPKLSSFSPIPNFTQIVNNRLAPYANEETYDGTTVAEKNSEIQSLLKNFDARSNQKQGGIIPERKPTGYGAELENVLRGNSQPTFMKQFNQIASMFETKKETIKTYTPKETKPIKGYIDTTSWSFIKPMLQNYASNSWLK